MSEDYDSEHVVTLNNKPKPRPVVPVVDASPVTSKPVAPATMEGDLGAERGDVLTTTACALAWEWGGEAGWLAEECGCVCGL